ncbi:MAG: glycosyltransferase family 39 protein [Candidatus Daviesbacteria bacterium]|nr:glycosyltransferase family 39 protein [Candidatus Daviesbacteria bacterium]
MIYLILIVGLILRVITLNQSLWLDEAINVVNARSLDLMTFLIKYPIGDFHPPGYFLILWLWGHLFGFSEVSVRIPSLIFGVGTIWLIFLLGKELFNKKIGIIAALLLAVAPLHIFYSQEARMYSLATFAVVASNYFFIRFLKNQKYSQIGFILSSILVVYSDYLAYLIFPAQFLYLLFNHKDKLVDYLKTFLGIILSLTIWLPFFYQQLLNGLKTANLVPGWAEVVGGANLKNLGLIFAKTILGRVSFDDKILYGVIISALGLLYGGIIVSALRKINDQVNKFVADAIKLLLFLIILPLILATVTSFFMPVLSYFRMLFILPAFYLLVAVGIEDLPKKFKAPTIIILVLISLSFLYFYYTNLKFQREDWRGAVSAIESLVQKDHGVIIFESNGNLAPFEYYSSGQKWLGGLKSFPAKDEKDIVAFDKNTKNLYVFEYLVDISDPGRNLEKSLIKQMFTEKEIYNFNGVGVVTHYSRF